MKQLLLVVGWSFVALALVAGIDNLVFQPATPGLFIAGADFVAALSTSIVLLDKAHHVFDVRR